MSFNISQCLRDEAGRIDDHLETHPDLTPRDRAHLISAANEYRTIAALDREQRRQEGPHYRVGKAGLEQCENAVKTFNYIHPSDVPAPVGCIEFEEPLLTVATDQLLVAHYSRTDPHVSWASWDGEAPVTAIMWNCVNGELAVRGFAKREDFPGEDLPLPYAPYQPIYRERYTFIPNIDLDMLAAMRRGTRAHLYSRLRATGYMVAAWMALVPE